MRFEKGYTPWNAGKSKENDPILLAMSETRKRQVAEGTGVPPSRAGQTPWNKGMKIDPEKYPNVRQYGKRSLETIEKIRASRKGKNVGKDNPMWKGGLTTIYSRLRTTREWTKWRKAVFARDDYTCQRCGANAKYDGQAVILEPHHIVGVTSLIRHKMKEHIFNQDNGITLCYSCHRFISAAKLMKGGEQYFSNLGLGPGKRSIGQLEQDRLGSIRQPVQL